MTMTIRKGETYRRVLRPTAPPFIYKQITAISRTAPVRLTVVGHGLVSGQHAAVVSVKGMTEINAESDRTGQPKASSYHKVTVIDVDTIEFNDINAAEFSAYTSGGYVQFLTPVDMAGCTARRTIRDRVGGTELLSMTTENGRIEIDNAAHTITETISATDTAALAWKTGVSDIELVTAGGEVTKLLSTTREPHEDVVAVEEITT